MGNGYTNLPRNQLVALSCSLLNIEAEEVSSAIETLIDEKELCSVQRNNEFIYLTDLYIAETYIANRLALMINVPCNAPDNIEQIIDNEEKQIGIKYADLQRKAIRQAIISNVFVLTGGPGTGKTTTLNAIINLLEISGHKISIAAPTGRAAKRISEVTGRDAKTIHRLLEVAYNVNDKAEFIKNEQNPLDSDAIIIDEMSMVDTLLFHSLLRATKPGCKLILVGDSDQLPSVGCGNVLKDIIESDCVPCVCLTEIFRQAAESLIVTNAHRIVAGEQPVLTEKSKDFFFMSRLQTNECLDTVCDLVYKRLPKSYNISAVNSIQVLCPQRKGEVGVININKKLQQLLNPPSEEKNEFSSLEYTFREGDKVMQTKNNYNLNWEKENEKGLGIFNGDIGVIVKIDKRLGMLKIDFDGRFASYSFDQAVELELAYAITVHKSQGSEFDFVVMPVLSGYNNLYYRNLLYTAVTRAKKMIVIVGSQNRLKFMVDNDKKTMRYTGLKHFIREFCGV